MANNPEQAAALAALDPVQVEADLRKCQRQHDDGWCKPGIVPPYGDPGLCACCEQVLGCGLFVAASMLVRR